MADLNCNNIYVILFHSNEDYAPLKTDEIDIDFSSSSSISETMDNAEITGDNCCHCSLAAFLMSAPSERQSYSNMNDAVRAIDEGVPRRRRRLRLLLANLVTDVGY